MQIVQSLGQYVEGISAREQLHYHADIVGADRHHYNHLVPPGSAGRSRLLTAAALAERQQGPDAVPLDASDEPVIMPEMSAAERAKRLQQVEAAPARMRSRRAVRWGNTFRRAQRRAAGLPVELLSAAGKAIRRRDSAG